MKYFVFILLIASVARAGLDVAGNLDVTGTGTIAGLGTGGYTDYDFFVGDTDGTPTYGIMQIGNGMIGMTSHNAGDIDLDRTMIFRNIAGPITGDIEFIFVESGGTSCRFALPKSAVGNATYNPRSMLIAGPAPADTDFVKVTYWRTNNSIFDNINCDTAGDGADLGIQNDLEVEGDIFCDSFKESTSGAGVTFNDDVHFDGADAGKDAGWDKSAHALGLLDNVDLGFGNTTSAPDVWTFWDGDSWELRARITGTTPWNIGTTAQGIDINWLTTLAGDFVHFDWTNKVVNFIDVDLQIGSETYGGELRFGANNSIGYDAANNDAVLGVSSGRHWRIDSHLLFSQVDENEFIGSDNDGFMDYGATTGHRFNATVTVNGLQVTTTTKTDTDYTLTANDDVVLFSTGATTRTATLPAAATVTGKIYHIKKIDSGIGFVTVDPDGSETIDGDMTPDIVAQYESWMISSDGSNWHVH